MRYRRAVIFRDMSYDERALNLFFRDRGYETMVVWNIAACPVYGNVPAIPRADLLLCCDVMIAVHDPPRLDGIELFRTQLNQGCRLPAENRALLSRTALTAEERDFERAMNIAWFPEPLDTGMLEEWLERCEARIGLDERLAMRRGARRRSCRKRVGIRTSSSEVGIIAIAVNISDEGICLRSERRLLPNQIVRVRGIAGRRSEDAFVRWAARDPDGYYRVGLTFCL